MWKKNWGWGEAFEKNHKSDGIVARIVAEHRGGFQVVVDQLEGLAKPRASVSRLGVGDWIVLSDLPSADEVVWIEEVLDRTTVFTRGAAGKTTEAQIIAANVDMVFAVTGLDHDFNLHRIERYVAGIWSSGALPVVILSKLDLVAPAKFFRIVDEVEARCPGVEVIALSALDGEGLDRLKELLSEGRTGAFVGSSGAGKSTLINTLLGEVRAATQDVRADDSKGRHTTTHRELFRLPTGGLVMDTPGMRAFQLVDGEGLDHAFAEIEAAAEECRFRDCQHQGEPGCAVEAAVEQGEIDKDRWSHYLQLKNEARAYEIRKDERLRRQAARDFGKVIASVKRTQRWKEKH